MNFTIVFTFFTLTAEFSRRFIDSKSTSTVQKRVEIYYNLKVVLRKCQPNLNETDSYHDIIFLRDKTYCFLDKIKDN